jgi:hypothetical protein
MYNKKTSLSNPMKKRLLIITIKFCKKVGIVSKVPSQIEVELQDFIRKRINKLLQKKK